MELNAHMLINVYRKLRQKNCLSLFIPELFSSQPCESFFRCARSLTSTQSTVINFTTKQFLAKIKRIEIIIALSAKYKEKKFTSNFPEVPVITDDEIFNLIISAKEEADKKLSELGVENPKEFMKIALENEKQKVKIEEKNFEDEDSELEELCYDENDDDIIEESSGYLEETRPGKSKKMYNFDPD